MIKWITFYLLLLSLVPSHINIVPYSGSNLTVVSTRQLLLGNRDLFLRVVQVPLYRVSVYTVLVAET